MKGSGGDPGSGDPSNEPRQAQLLEEWKSIQEDIRHFGRKRFVQLTVFVALIGLLGREAIPPDRDPMTHLILGALGFTLSVTFALMELSTVEYVRSWYERAKEIEDETYLELLSGYLPPRRGKSRLRRATTMTFALYVVLGLASLTLAVWGAYSLLT